MLIRDYVGAMCGVAIMASATLANAQVPDFCALFGLAVSGPVVAAGATEGIPFAFAPGTVITMTLAPASPIPATSASWRIIGGVPLPTLAGPAGLNQTLTYTVPSGGLPAGSVGIGFLVDAIDGVGFITASCTAPPPQPVPALNAWMLATLAGLLALSAGWLARGALRRR